MKEKKVGLVSIKMLKDKIAEEHNLKVGDIVVHTTHRDYGISITFDKKTNDKYSTTIAVEIEKPEIITIVKEILDADGIHSTDIKLKFEHIPGDSFEPLDYGSYKFTGFEFTFVE